MSGYKKIPYRYMQLMPVSVSTTQLNSFIISINNSIDTLRNYINSKTTNIQEELIKMQAEIDLLKSQVTILNLTIKTTTNIPLLLQQIQLLNPQSWYNLGLVEKNNFSQRVHPLPLSEHIVQINSTDTEVILFPASSSIIALV